MAHILINSNPKVLTGKCYEAQIVPFCSSMQLFPMALLFWLKSKFSVSRQKAWTIVRRFDQPRVHFLCSFYSLHAERCYNDIKLRLCHSAPLVLFPSLSPPPPFSAGAQLLLLEGATESFGKLQVTLTSGKLQVTLTSEEHTGSLSVRRFALSEDTLQQNMPTATAQAVRTNGYILCIW